MAYFLLLLLGYGILTFEIRCSPISEEKGSEKDFNRIKRQSSGPPDPWTLNKGMSWSEQYGSRWNPFIREIMQNFLVLTPSVCMAGPGRAKVPENIIEDQKSYIAKRGLITLPGLCGLEMFSALESSRWFLSLFPHCLKKSLNFLFTDACPPVLCGPEADPAAGGNKNKDSSR